MNEVRNILIVLLMVSVGLNAQTKFATKSGRISFEASVPSFEPVAAVHENVSALLNAETGEFAALALVNGFRFEIALMEEHFNENYMESGEFPKAVFKGTISNFVWDEMSDQPLSYGLEGSLDIHGVTRPHKTQVNVTRVSPNSLMITTEFVLNPEDFDIDIPNIVRNKIAKEVKVMASFELKARE